MWDLAENLWSVNFFWCTCWYYSTPNNKSEKPKIPLSITYGLEIRNAITDSQYVTPLRIHNLQDHYRLAIGKNIMDFQYIRFLWIANLYVYECLENIIFRNKSKIVGRIRFYSGVERKSLEVFVCSATYWVNMH